MDFVITDDSEFRKVCLSIFQMIQKAADTGETNAGIKGLCSSLDNLETEAKKYARLISSRGTLGPTFMLFSKAGSGICCPILLTEMPNTLGGQYSFMAPMAITINLAPVDAYFFVSEAWYAVYHRDQVNIDEDGVHPIRPVSDREDRDECLIVGCYRPDETRMMVFETIRDADGKVADFKLAERHEFPMSPLMENFFDKSADIERLLNADDLKEMINRIKL